MKSTYSVLGGMAGSSMDGLDLALVDFTHDKNRWTFNIDKADTIAYSHQIEQELKNVSSVSPEKQVIVDQLFAEWSTNAISEFIAGFEPQLIGFHGHTVKHDPYEGISWQLGSGQSMADRLHLPVVTDFRSLDISLGGQGAPLVPFGDFVLFNEFDGCLNLGGIANLSLREKQIGWDICPCNQLLNYFAEQLGLPYDNGGKLAASGNVNEHLIEQLSQQHYFQKAPPKSLPNGFLMDYLKHIEPHEALATCSAFIARRIGAELSTVRPGKLLITGGGAHNTFLVSLIRNRLSSWEIVVPSVELTDYKEAIIFAFLALMRSFDQPNVLASVTGASRDSSSGVLHLP
jgi:anhydro-N-acetylmuramic acid kinase